MSLKISGIKHNFQQSLCQYLTLSFNTAKSYCKSETDLFICDDCARRLMRFGKQLMNYLEIHVQV